MGSLPPTKEVEFGRLITYTVECDESMCGAIVEAFLLAGVEVSKRETVLEDWLDTDALERLYRASGRSPRVSAQIWDHPVVITDETVTVYADPAADQREE